MPVRLVDHWQPHVRAEVVLLSVVDASSLVEWWEWSHDHPVWCCEGPLARRLSRHAALLQSLGQEHERALKQVVNRDMRASPLYRLASTLSPGTLVSVVTCGERGPLSNPSTCSVLSQETMRDEQIDARIANRGSQISVTA